MLPAPGQGALAIEAREDDVEIAKLLVPLEDHSARLSSSTEREILHALGGGCQLPLGTFVRSDGDKYLIDACIAYPNGEGMIKRHLHSSENELLYNAKMIAGDFLTSGGKELIASLTGVQESGKKN